MHGDLAARNLLVKSLEPPHIKLAGGVGKNVDRADGRRVKGIGRRSSYTSAACTISACRLIYVARGVGCYLRPWIYTSCLPAVHRDQRRCHSLLLLLLALLADFGLSRPAMPHVAVSEIPTSVPGGGHCAPSMDGTASVARFKGAADIGGADKEHSGGALQDPVTLQALPPPLQSLPQQPRPSQRSYINNGDIVPVSRHGPSTAHAALILMTSAYKVPSAG